MEVSLLQIINIKKLTKTACLSRVVVQYVYRKILQFYKRYFINLYQMKALEIRLFGKFKLTKSDFYFNLLTFFQKPPFFYFFCHFFSSS